MLHCCCICGKVEEWAEGWSWYGSIKESENGKPVAKFCSSACAEKAGLSCENITPEMKIAAQKRQEIAQQGGNIAKLSEKRCIYEQLQ